MAEWKITAEQKELLDAVMAAGKGHEDAFGASASSRARLDRDRETPPSVRMFRVVDNNRVAAEQSTARRQAQAGGAARFLEQTALGSPWAEDALDREAEAAWWTARRIGDGFKSRG